MTFLSDYHLIDLRFTSVYYTKFINEFLIPKFTPVRRISSTSINYRKESFPTFANVAATSSKRDSVCEALKKPTS